MFLSGGRQSGWCLAVLRHANLWSWKPRAGAGWGTVGVAESEEPARVLVGGTVEPDLVSQPDQTGTLGLKERL